MVHMGGSQIPLGLSELFNYNPSPVSYTNYIGPNLNQLSVEDEDTDINGYLQGNESPSTEQIPHILLTVMNLLTVFTSAKTTNTDAPIGAETVVNETVAEIFQI